MKRLDLRRPAGAMLTLALGLLGLRLVSMLWVPYIDTTEPRYAEIARLMAQSGDWVTPWFEPGVPFWGKPPLSFWLQALSMKLFGLSEWVARFPAWVATALTLWPLHALARAWAGRRAAAAAVLIHVTCALPYMMAGAVLTDPFLALGTTLFMAGLMLPQWHWRLLAAVGLAIGLLAKGPLALVIVAGPAALCLLAYRRRVWPALSMRGWLVGLSLVASLVVPWYVIAEIRTPGFWDYFLIGEHVRRFLEPGWAGDLYGTAHRRAIGAIWLGWLAATLPWSPLALAMLAAALRHRRGRGALLRLIRRPMTGYLIAWALFVPLFFTLSRNILWTYVLPALPAFAILTGRALVLVQRRLRLGRSPALHAVGTAPALFVPVVTLLATLAICFNPGSVKTEKALIRQVMSVAPPGATLWFVDSRSFSARYYSRGQALLISSEELPALVAGTEGAIFIAARPDVMARLQTTLPLTALPLADSRRYRVGRIR
ncbi:ArnT family glycosyltransferase [Billgrantia endophytica]|nr:phospholipid carrier-dependent glycosyltransferase [Halomonas endophytica]